MKRILLAFAGLSLCMCTALADTYDSATNALAQIWGEKFEVAALTGLREPVSAAEWDLVGIRGEAITPLPYDRSWVFQLDTEPFGQRFMRERPVVVFSEDLLEWDIYESSIPVVLKRIADGSQRALEGLNDDAVPRVITPPAVAKSRLLSANALKSNAFADDNTHLYALLISGGYDKFNNGIRFYEDVTNAYTVLHKECGVPKANIFAYAASGDPTKAEYELGGKCYTVPFDIDNDSVNEIRGGANEGVDVCITNLAAQLTAEDRLFVLVSSHGSPQDASVRTMDSKVCLWGKFENDDDYAAKFEDFKCPVAFLQEHCYSGGFADDLAAGTNRVILTASNPFEMSWGYQHWNVLPFCFNWGIEKAGLYNFYDAAMFAIVNDYDMVIEHPMYVETTPKLGYEFRFDTGTTPATNYVEYTFDAGAGSCLSTNFWYRQGEEMGFYPDAFSDNGIHEGWQVNGNHCMAVYLPFVTPAAQQKISGFSGASSFVLDPYCYQDLTWTAPCDGKVVFSLNGSYGTGTLGIYNGSTTVTSYTPDGAEWSTVNFMAQKGVEYKVMVNNNTYGAIVTVRLSWDMGKLPLTMLLY